MPNFFFQRYVNGERMADDVLITKQPTLEAAIPEALRLCRNSPRSVLVHITDDSSLREENAWLQEENDAWRMDGGSCAEEVKRLREENAQLQAQREKDKRLNHETESGLLEENVRLREETDEWEKSHNTLVKEIEHLRLLVIQLEDYNKALAAEFREENARMRKGRRDLLHVLLTNVSLSMEAFDVNAAIREEDND